MKELRGRKVYRLGLTQIAPHAWLLKISAHVVLASGCLFLLLLAFPLQSHALTLDQVFQILAGNVLSPSSSNDEVVVRLTATPLPPGTAIQPEPGTPTTLSANTWFAFVDDHPCALFSHGVRYVFID